MEEAWTELIYFKPTKNRELDRLTNSNSYVSGTTIKNYLLRDPLLDWFELYTPEFKDKVDDTLMVLGNEFENRIVSYLQDKFMDQIIVINHDGQKGLTETNFRKTIDAIKSGIPIISQAVLFNHHNMTNGIADLLVRSDYINKIVDQNVIEDDDINIRAPLLDQYHYRVIDIKWTTLLLCNNKLTIRNKDRIPSYKGQLTIYNSILGQIQGYTPSQAYIMGKGWIRDNERCYDCFNTLGIIDYTGFDFCYINKTREAIEWIREVRRYGISWDPKKPRDNKRLYPNMANKYDSGWESAKKRLCMRNQEITQLWQVSDTNRNVAVSNKIRKIKHVRSSEDLGIGGRYGYVIDKILNINRPECNFLVQPVKIVSRYGRWNIETSLDFYIDFETVNGSLYGGIKLREKPDPDIVFMIGVGWVNNGVWNYKHFITERLDEECETHMFEEFYNFVNSFVKRTTRTRKPRFFHWAHAEPSWFNKVSTKNNGKWDNWDIKWIDIYSLFVYEPITVKGAYNYRLKTITNAMKKNGLIDIQWNDDMDSGFSAMMEAVKYYNGKGDIDKIIKYNEIDCKAVFEIVKYLRRNHV